MEPTEIIAIIDRINDYRMLKFRRDNLKEQMERLSNQGYDIAAHDRFDLLAQTQRDLDRTEPGILETIRDIKQRYSLHPKDKALKLIVLYIELLDTPPLQMKKVRQRINSLRPQVLGSIDDIQQIRDETSLFAD